MPASFTPSPNVAQVKESATIAVAARSRALRAQGRRIVDLGVGEPDFETPEFIRRAAQAAIDAGATKYTATEGILPLREAVADHLRPRWRGPLPVEPADVVVSSGSKHSLYNACMVLFGPGDEVLIPTPAWTSYYEMVGLARATAVPVYGDPTRGFKVDADALRAAATPRTRGLFLNSPSNPTGAVYDADELRALLALAEERGWYVLSDEIYDRITYGAAAPSALDVATSRERLVVINGVAKSYAMTGWRIGWTLSSRPVAQWMTALQSHATSNPSTPAQHAALAALTHRAEADAAIHAMVQEFHHRRDLALRILAEEPRIPFIPPEGAFYLYLRAPGGDDAGTTFAARLLDDAGVAIVPGSAFLTPAWIRVSYAADRAQVEEGFRAIVNTWRALAD